MASKSMTRNQEQLICSLHERIGTRVPDDIRKLDVREAAMYIDLLTAQSRPAPRENGPDSNSSKGTAAEADTLSPLRGIQAAGGDMCVPM
jgi:hypothetical protein